MCSVTLQKLDNFTRFLSQSSYALTLYFYILFASKILFLTTLTKNLYIILVDNILLQSKPSIQKSFTKFIAQYNEKGFNIKHALSNS